MDLLEVRRIDESLYGPLENFCYSCGLLGYMNNNSFEKMKLHWVETVDGAFWCILRNDTIIGVAGAHRLSEISTNAFRIQFRGCELPGLDTYRGLSRAQFGSSTFRELIPYEIEWCANRGSDELYISTNYSQDNSGKMIRNHRTMGLMAQQEILSHHSNIQLYGVEQTIWRLNIDNYLAARKKISCYTIQPPPLI